MSHFHATTIWNFLPVLMVTLVRTGFYSLIETWRVISFFSTLWSLLLRLTVKWIVIWFSSLCMHDRWSSQSLYRISYFQIPELTLGRVKIGCLVVLLYKKFTHRHWMPSKDFRSSHMFTQAFVLYLPILYKVQAKKLWHNW